jgi:hypothetical protein
MVFVEAVPNTRTHRFQMRFRCRRTNNEIVGETRNAAEVENNDILRLLISRQFGTLAR